MNAAQEQIKEIEEQNKQLEKENKELLKAIDRTASQSLTANPFPAGEAAIKSASIQIAFNEQKIKENQKTLKVLDKVNAELRTLATEVDREIAREARQSFIARSERVAEGFKGLTQKVATLNRGRVAFDPQQFRTPVAVAIAENRPKKAKKEKKQRKSSSRKKGIKL